MTIVLDIAEPQRQTFLEFIKTLPYITVVSGDVITDEEDWSRQTAQQFLAGYADSDSIYDEV
jgi:hypothetical protein